MRPERKTLACSEAKITEAPSAVYKQLADLESNMYALNGKISTLRSKLGRVLTPEDECEKSCDSEPTCEPYLLSDRLEYDSAFILSLVGAVADLTSRLEI